MRATTANPITSSPEKKWHCEQSFLPSTEPGHRPCDVTFPKRKTHPTLLNPLEICFKSNHVKARLRICIAALDPSLPREARNNTWIAGVINNDSSDDAMISAPWEARKSQSYTVSEATSTQRAALNHQAAGPTKKCFGSARISKERRPIPPMT